MYSATRGKTPGSETITFDPPPLTRSAEKCFDVYAYSYGVMTDGSGYYYNQTRRWDDDRDDLPPAKCDNTANAAGGFVLPWSDNDVFSELRQIIQVAQASDPSIVGAVNLNGVISTIRDDGEIEEETISSFVEVPRAPSIRKVLPRKLTLTWASLKK